MKILPPALRIALLAATLLAPAACAHKETKSSWHIYEEGEDNPMISYDPSRAGERVRTGRER